MSTVADGAAKVPDARTSRPLRLAPSLRRVALALLPPIAFCALLAVGWELMATYRPNPLLPRLALVGAELAEIVRSGDAVAQIAVTLQRILFGFVVAYAIAIAIGLASARNRAAKAFFEPALVLGLTVPGLVWALLCVVWFGLSLRTSVVAIALGIAPALALSITQGLAAVDPHLIEAAHVFRLSRAAKLRHLWLPAIIPDLLSGARLGFSLAWKVVVLVEIFGLPSGVGYRLNSAFSSQNVAEMLAWTIAFTVLMAAIEYGLMQTVERRVTRWKRVARV
jgi:NitT/TauT family transport system permease protein